jgi:hypothetical protein
MGPARRAIVVEIGDARTAHAPRRTRGELLDSDGFPDVSAITFGGRL